MAGGSGGDRGLDPGLFAVCRGDAGADTTAGEVHGSFIEGLRITSTPPPSLRRTTQQDKGAAFMYCACFFISLDIDAAPTINIKRTQLAVCVIFSCNMEER